MNPFIWVMLAFPFYLAVNKRLVNYVELAAPPKFVGPVQ